VTWKIHQGDALEVLRTLPAESAQTCVTSPPYWGLRDYGVEGQLGLEPTPEEYVARMVGIFAEVRRVLRDDGTLWLNLGDSYTGAANSGGANRNDGGPAVRVSGLTAKSGHGLKPKDLVGIPWRVAFALQADGWYLRSDIIWAKPNPMPESVTDRPTKAHEYVFLLAKSERYFFDQEAVREPASPNKPWGASSNVGTKARQSRNDGNSDGLGRPADDEAGRNIRSVWTITTKPFSGAHFAVMPPDLAERCIKAGSRIDDVVLDPFSGAGTTAMVARRLQRRAIGIELNPEYIRIAEQRIDADQPLFNRAVQS